MEINEQFWNGIKLKLKGRNSSNSYLETMLDNINFLEKSGEPSLPKIVLGVPNTFFQFMVQENLLKEIVCEITETYKSPFNVDLVVTGKEVEQAAVDSNSQLNVPIESDASHAYSRPQSVNTQINMTTQDSHLQIGYLNPDYIFSTFVVGRNAEFAHAASYNVAQNPGTRDYNPLFICGPVGMGKTHLINAVGNQIRQSFPHLRITYVSAERFLNE